MGSPRVMILSDQALFAEGLKSLIETRTALSVIAVEPLGSVNPELVRAWQPEIIVLGDSEGLPAVTLTALLDCAPNVRIVRIALSENTIRVYDGHQMVAHHVQDLVDALSSLARPQEAGETNAPGGESRR
jgi:hypothetical protein